MNEAQRNRIIERDGGRCKLGPHENDTYRLDVHHFIGFVPGIGMVNAYEKEEDKDMVTLCRNCHGILKNAGTSRKRWGLYRRLVQVMYGVDVGPCMVHRWVHRNGLTYCAICETPK